MLNFGFIGEGKTDFYVIRRLLYTYYNPNIPITSLSPEIDNDIQVSQGGWTKVFEYCKSFDLVSFLEANDKNHLIIHIDTDKSHEKGFDIIRNKEDINGQELLLEVIEKFWTDIFHKDLDRVKYNNRIIFAITINKIECWLISAYTSAVQARNINNCEGNLQTLLNKAKEKVVLSRRDNNDYDYLARKFSKKDLKKKPANNVGFKHFIDNLPVIKEEESSTGSILI